MSNYLIGIGGSGAKCIESFVHLGAAGMMAANPRQKCWTLFVDPDTANGSLGRAQTTLQSYLNAVQVPFGLIDAFSLDMGTLQKRVWSPLPEHESRTLSSFFSYRDPHEANRMNSRFMDVLFSPKQIELNLNDGFRGNPSIGAAIFGGTVDLANEEPWRELYGLLKHDSADAGGAQVLLVGSVFGGTGASGVPTIAKIIADDLNAAGIKNVRLGAVLLLPYFSFGDVQGEAVQAKSQEFLPNTQIALQYYYDRRYLDVFQGVYLLGEHQLSSVSVAKVGGRDQTNDAHPIEMTAALAAVDFFRHRDEAKGCMLAARKSQDAITWRDLPAPIDLDLRLRVGQFLRFTYAYLSMCYSPLMEFVRTKNDYNTVWIPTFFPKRANVDFAEIGKRAEHMRAYCELFLVWLGEMHYSASRASIPLDVAHVDRFVDFLGDPPRVKLKQNLQAEFKSLVLPHSKEGLDFKQIYEGLGDAKPSDTNATSGFGQLVNELYRLAGERFK